MGYTAEQNMLGLYSLTRACARAGARAKFQFTKIVYAHCGTPDGENRVSLRLLVAEL